VIISAIIPELACPCEHPDFANSGVSFRLPHVLERRVSIFALPALILAHSLEVVEADTFVSPILLLMLVWLVCGDMWVLERLTEKMSTYWRVTPLILLSMHPQVRRSPKGMKVSHGRRDRARRNG